MNTICIMCPIGCQLDVKQTQQGIIVDGNACKRGQTYGENEFTNPVRQVSTLVKTTDGRYLSVKTSIPVAKNKVTDVAAFAKTVIAPTNSAIGDTVAKNVLNTDADLVVTGVN